MHTLTARDEVAAGWLAAASCDNTRAAYSLDLAAFFTWCDQAGVDTLKASRVQLDHYRQHLVRSGYKPATLHRKLAAVSSFYQHGTEEFEKLVPHNVMKRVKRPRVSNESTTAGLDLDEARRLLAVARDAGSRDSAMVHVLAYTGVRVSEMCGVTVMHLSTERGSRMVQVSRKGGETQRLVVAPPAVVELDAYLDGRRAGPLFIGARKGPVTRHEVARALSRLLPLARIDKRITPHSLRHTAATLALDAGVDIREVQRMLGHKHMETTMRYDRARDRVDRSPAHALARLLEGS